MRIVLSVVFFLSVTITNAQIITVVDVSNKNPISNVLIYLQDGGWSVSTNERGNADISAIGDEELLFFQHPSYREFVTSKNKILNTTVALSEKIIHIEEIVVSANRWEQDIDKVPQEIMSINRNLIEQRQPQTSADMLAATGQVYVQKSQLGGGSPMLRGFAANNVLLVVDGVRMNNAIYRSGNLQNVINIDPLALEGTEVIFGPGSVIYGSDALGGVMDFHTITPHFGLEKTLFSGEALTRYSSANNEKTGHFHFTLGGKKLSFFSSISYSDFEDLRAGSNFPDEYPNFGRREFYVQRINDVDVVLPNNEPELQRPTGFNLFSSINKLRYRIENWDITYSLYYSTTNDFPRYDRLTETEEDGQPAFAEWYYGPQRWLMNTLRIEHFGENPVYDRMKIVLAQQKVEESRHNRRLNNVRRRNQFEEVDIFSANIDFDKSFTNSNLYYGLEAVTNDIQSEANRINIITGELSDAATRYPSGGSRWNSYAGYASYVWELERLNINAGARYSFVTLDAENEETGLLGRENVNISTGAVTGSLGAVYELNEKVSFRGNLSSGFRAPNIDDVGKIFEVSESAISVPNEDLNPQYTYTGELSTSYKSDKWYLDLTGYYTTVDQVMTRSNFTVNGSSIIAGEEGEILNVVALTNSGNANILGFSASLKRELTQDLGFITHFTYTWGEEEGGVPLRHVPPAFGQWQLIYKKGQFRGSIFMDYHLRKNADDIPPSENEDKPHLYAPDGSTPAWYTLNFSAGYHFENGFNLRLNGENLFDRHYRTYSSGISAPGRNFIFSIGYIF